MAAKDPTWQAQYHGARENEAVNEESIANVTFDHGMLLRKGKVWVPNHIKLKKKILDAEHDSEVAGHMGMDKTGELIKHNFYWPGMDEEIEDYISKT